MGRDPKQRDTYRGDATTTARILRAIELDESCSPDWKQAALEAGEHFFRLLALDHKAPLLKKAG